MDLKHGHQMVYDFYWLMDVELIWLIENGNGMVNWFV